jgi:hypothetical protein
VLLDLELPLLNRRLFRENRGTVGEARGWLERIFSEASLYGVEIVTAEYPPFGGMVQRFWERMGVSYPLERYPHQKIVMWYNSLIPEMIQPWSRRSLSRYVARHGEAIQVGLGTISHGIFGNEPILSPSSLARDLSFLQGLGVRDIVIFRLGGMKEAYWEVLKSDGKTSGSF